jgi:hypothetical protein
MVLRPSVVSPCHPALNPSSCFKPNPAKKLRLWLIWSVSATSVACRRCSLSGSGSARQKSPLSRCSCATCLLGWTAATRAKAGLSSALVDLLRQRDYALPGQTMFRSGDSVVISDGPLSGMETVYQAVYAERRAFILLEILSKPVSMYIDAGWLRKVG